MTAEAPRCSEDNDALLLAQAAHGADPASAQGSPPLAGLGSPDADPAASMGGLWLWLGLLGSLLGLLAAVRLSALPVFAFGVAGSATLGALLVPLLRRWKAGQVIRQEGPQSHLKKAGTPTMGGISFLPVGLLVALAWSAWDPQVLAVALLTLAYGFVGWLDDWQVIRQQSNKGLSPRQKLLLQLGIAALFCGYLAWQGIPTALTLPGVGTLSLGWLFWPLAVFALVGTNNAVNLTDGMDGLAAGVVAIVLVGLGLIHRDPELAVLAFALSGACGGFLAHNHHKARVFMGDTGSLGLGGALAGLALLGDQLWALALMGGVLVVEALSVILQVSYFKYSKRKTGVGKRLLRMSPLHHHLELGGWSEVQVVGSLYILTALLVGLGWAGWHGSGV
ncbi:MAG: phospho-N-acetylmuramoyl-pentapeptide-transferase [Thermostichus sp. HHBFW_bins_43]